MTTYRLYPSTSGPASSSGDPGSYVMGLSFVVDISGATLTGYYWWVADAEQNVLSMNFGLWEVTGPAAGTFQASSEATIGDDLLTIGWNFIPLSPAFNLVQNQEYRAVCKVYAGGGATSGYSATSHFWDTESRRGRHYQRPPLRLLRCRGQRDGGTRGRSPDVVHHGRH